MYFPPYVRLHRLSFLTPFRITPRCILTLTKFLPLLIRLFHKRMSTLLTRIPCHIPCLLHPSRFTRSLLRMFSLSSLLRILRNLCLRKAYHHLLPCLLSVLLTNLLKNMSVNALPRPGNVAIHRLHVKEVTILRPETFHRVPRPGDPHLLIVSAAAFVLARSAIGPARILLLLPPPLQTVSEKRPSLIPLLVHPTLIIPHPT